MEKKEYLRICLSAFLIQLLIALGTALVYLLAQSSSPIAYPLLKIIRFISLLYLAYILGIAFALLQRRGLGSSFLLLAVAALADFSGGLLSLFLKNLITEEPFVWVEILQTFTAALESTLLPLTILFSGSYLLFFSKSRKRPAGLFDFSAPLPRSLLITAGLSLLYKLVFQIIDTVEFVNSVFGMVSAGEKLAIVMDFLLIFLGALAHYLLAYAICMRLCYPKENGRNDGNR